MLKLRYFSEIYLFLISKFSFSVEVLIRHLPPKLATGHYDFGTPVVESNTESKTLHTYRGFIWLCCDANHKSSTQECGQPTSVADIKQDNQRSKLISVLNIRLMSIVVSR